MTNENPVMFEFGKSAQGEPLFWSIDTEATIRIWRGYAQLYRSLGGAQFQEYRIELGDKNGDAYGTDDFEGNLTVENYPELQAFYEAKLKAQGAIMP